jgi:hypothetical protein
MRRFAVVVSALAALMLVWTGAALAQDDPPGCNGTIFLSSSAGDTPGTEPKYTQGDTIYVNGTGFDSAQAFTGYTVDDVNDGENIITSNTPWTADANGDFSFSFVASAENGFTDAHEYKVTVYFTKEVGNADCRKSKNFFLTVEEGGGAGGQPPPPPAGPQPTPPPPPGGGGAGAGGGGSLGEEGGSGGQGALPFTGLPFALLAGAGLALILGGLALRRTARTDG